ncbi:MAG: alpha/beta fold hydrolase [Saprospiraceae bacterium]
MELHYKDYGSGEPLLILHGVFGMSDNWHTIAKILSEYYWVIVPDLRNHGRSGHSEELNYDVMSGDILQLIEKLHIRKCNIIGHSMGGKLVMNFALEYPEYIDKMMVLEIGVKQYSGNHEFILEALNKINPANYNDRRKIEMQLLEYIPNIRIVNFLMKNIKLNSDNTSYEWKFNLKAISENYNQLLSSINSDHGYLGEALFVKGGNSDYILEYDWKDILELFPNAQLHTIASAGHWIHADKQQELVNEIKNFLK